MLPADAARAGHALADSVRATPGPGAAALEYLRGLGEVALGLLAVQTPYWVGLFLITVLRVLAETWWAPKAEKVKTRTVLKRSFKMLFAVYALTILGNMAPVFGWLIVAAWTGAAGLTARAVVTRATADDVEAARFFGSILWRAILRRIVGDAMPEDLARDVAPEAFGKPVDPYGPGGAYGVPYDREPGTPGDPAPEEPAGPGPASDPLPPPLPPLPDA